MRLVLASASPRRAELLAAAGFAFEVMASDIDERRLPDEPPENYVRRLAREKAERAWDRLAARGDDIVVVGADTAVIADGDVLGKPSDAGDSASMIARLSGRSHQVLTGVSLRSPTGEVGAVVATTVWFNDLDADAIAWYVASGEGRDKAGAYAIQGLASRFIPKIEGSYTNVVGLPVATVFELLQRLPPLAGSTL